jgi:hypothetical protein
VAFSNDDLHFEVSGAATGVLQKTVELKPGIWLYSMPLELEAGIHKIRISGALEKEIEFAVNTVAPPFRFTPKAFINPWAVIVCFVLLAVWHLTIIVGMFGGGSCFAGIKETSDWLIGESDESHWLVAVLGGPLVLGCGMRGLPIWAKAMYLTGFIWGVCLPGGFFKIEDTVAAIWLGSYIVNGQVFGEMMYLLFPMAYLMLILFSFVCSLSIYEYTITWWIGIDILVALAGLAGGTAVWMIAGTPVADNHMWLTSFEYFVFPLVFIATVAFAYYGRSARKPVASALGDYLSAVSSDDPRRP